jgi:hypothetical protein
MGYGRIAAALLAIFVSACGGSLTSDIKAESAADEKVNFSGMKSYAWFGGLGALVDDTNLWAQPNFDMAQEAKFVIDRELRKKGFSESSSDPDVFVAFLLVADVNQVKKIDDERGANVENLEGVGKGALLIELIDAETTKTIWLGGATAQVSSKYTDDERKQRLDYAITELIGQLPK